MTEQDYRMLHRKIERVVDDWWDGLATTNAALSEIKEVFDLFRPPAERDTRPHSRACGIHQHAHGSACSTNCPTCHGVDE